LTDLSITVNYALSNEMTLVQVRKARNNPGILSVLQFSHCFSHVKMAFIPDFLELDDLQLSQIAEEMENGNDFHLSQAVADVDDGMINSAVTNRVKDEDHFEDFRISPAASITDVNLTISQVMTYHVDFVDYGTFDFSYLDETYKTEPQSNRFSPIVSDEEIDQLISAQKNANTTKNTKWAIKVFDEWRSERVKNGIIIPDLLSMDNKTMNSFLQRFVIEARKRNGDEYPPKSLYYLICGIMRHCKDNKLLVNFFDEKDNSFAQLRKVLDARMKELLSKGLGTKPKKADVLSEEDEDILWSSGVFGQSCAQSLQYTVFFLFL